MTKATDIIPVPRRLLAGITVILLALVAAGSLTAADAQAKQQRVVSISPFATDVLAEVGVRPIAIGQVLSDKRGMKRVPRQFRNVRVLPLSHPSGPNLETLAKLRPTVVLSSKRWRKGTAAMRDLGIRVVYADPTNLGQAYAQAKTVGRAVKRKRQGAKLSRKMRAQVKSATRGIRKGPRVMGILGVGRNPQTFLANSWGGQMISLAGGRLVTAGVKNSGGFAPISPEVVVAQDPAVIIGVPHGSVTDISGAFDYILENPAWQTVAAIRNGQVKGSYDNRLLQAGTDVGQTIRIINRCLNSRTRATCN
ncbi:MAG: ABC transporter substrate-binding protein [Solirubrobacterales bacterium]|nr:ABC transporter substrate-binding protein [Solirubrobacterales bacterium]